MMQSQDQNSQHIPASMLREIVAEQEAKIAQLEQELKQEHFAGELHTLLTSSVSAGLILSPFKRSHLLELIVQTASRFLNARSSSLFLLDDATQELVFEVAIGPAAAAVKKFRVPLGHGIAGLVALTGQPLAIADAQQDGRLALDIAFAVNYLPQNILCVPLFYDDRVIGALELLDKEVNPPFDLHDVDMAGHFANIAATAIAQSNAFLDQQAFFQTLIQSFGEIDAGLRQQLYGQAVAFAHWMNTTSRLNTKAYELAVCVHQLILDGEQSCDLCLNMLQGIVTGLHERRKLQESLQSIERVSLISR